MRLLEKMKEENLHSVSNCPVSLTTLNTKLVHTIGHRLTGYRFQEGNGQGL